MAFVSLLVIACEQSLLVAGNSSNVRGSHLLLFEYIIFLRLNKVLVSLVLLYLVIK